jgi:selenocysteine lyase/cysteine desulfurase
MVNWEQIRKEFPVCGNYVYLNPAGGSPMSVSAAAGAKSYIDEMLELGDLPYDRWMEKVSDIRAKMARFIGAQKEEIAFVPNTSSGMSYIAHMLKGMGEVVTMEDEFPSGTIPWLNLDYTLHFVKSNHGRYTTERIEKTLTPRTRILVTSHVQYRTGYRQDLQALGRFCSEKGLIFIVNATQSLPVFPVDVNECRIDFLVFTGLKWASSGYGTGVLYLRKKWLEALKTTITGWRSVVKPELMDNARFSIAVQASALEGGCPPFAPVFALGGALDLFNRIGPENAAKRVLYLSGYLDQKLRHEGFDVFSPADEEHRSGIVMIKSGNAAAVAAKLLEKKIFVSARGRGLRVSVSIFNNETDLDFFIRELKKLRDIL